MWGQAALINRIAEVKGIIPTRVGTRTLLYHRTTVTKDHPHACGDKEAREYLKDGVKGSSPRVWGQAESCTAALYSARIIPTRVGTSHSRFLSLQLRKDHPHACGDKKGVLLGYLQVPGSSPRVWGQVGSRPSGRKGVRIIPTRVGTSRLTVLRS